MDLPTGIQESLLALLCFDDAPGGAKSVRALVPAKTFDPFFRDVAEQAERYLDRHKQAPGEHTLDIIQSLQARKPDHKEIYERLWVSLNTTKDSINREYVLAQASRFARFQRMRAGITKALDLLQQDKENSVDEAEAVLSGTLKHTYELFRPGLVLNDPKDALSFLHQEDEYFDTLIPELDKYNLGPMRKGLHLFVALPNRGKSLGLGARVWDPARGYRAMAELVRHPEGGFSSYGVHRHTHHPEVTHVHKVFSSGTKRTCTIRLRSGREVRGFADTHPVLTLRGYVRTDELAVGDFVVGAAQLPLSGTCPKPQEAYAVGAFLGDGCLVAKEPRLSLHEDETDVLAGVLAALRQYPAPSVKACSAHGVEVMFSRKVFQFLDGWGVARVKGTLKSVPRRVYAEGPEAVAACLAGLFDTDGSAYVGGGGFKIELTTASYALSEDYLTMLNVLGIYARRVRRRINLGGKAFTAWAVLIGDATSVATFARRVGCYGHNRVKWSRVRRVRLRTRDDRGPVYNRMPWPVLADVKQALESCDDGKTAAGLMRYCGHGGVLTTLLKNRSRVSCDFIRRASAYLGDPNLAQWASGDFTFDEVVEIRWQSPEPCYDMSTQEDHQSFLAEHVFTHNSWWGIQLGRAALMQRRRVLHVTLEMGEHKVAQRYVQSFLSVSKRSEELKRLTFETDANGHFVDVNEVDIGTRPSLQDARIESVLRAGVKRVLGRMPKLIVRQFPTGQLSIRDFNAYLDNLEGAAAFVPDLIVVDYADLMSIRSDRQREETGKIYKDLRGIAVERNVAIATMTQSNRDGLKSKMLTERNASEDFSKIHTADTVITYNQTDEEYRLGLARLFVAKARDDVARHRVLISQAYKVGQFCMESVRMGNESGYWKLMDKDKQHEED